MTVEDNYDIVDDNSYLIHSNSITNIDLGSQGQQSLHLCDECGFILCICEYILGFNAETGFWIVDDQGEL